MHLSLMDNEIETETCKSIAQLIKTVWYIYFSIRQVIVQHERLRFDEEKWVVIKFLLFFYFEGKPSK